MNVNQLPGNAPVSAGGTVPMQEALNRAKQMASTIPENTGEFIRYLHLLKEVEAEMIQRFGEDGHMQELWQAARQRQIQKAPDQGGIAGIGNVTEQRIENLLSHLSFAQDMQNPTPTTDPVEEDPVDKITRLLALMIEVTGTSLAVQQRFTDTVERLEALLAQQAERVETWNAAVVSQEAAEGTLIEADAEHGHQEDQQPSIAQQFRTGAPTFQGDEDEDEDNPPVPDLLPLSNNNMIPNVHMQSSNRKLLWGLAQQFNWHRAAVQMMCRNLSRDQDPQHLTNGTWDSILATMEDPQAITYWHQQLADFE